MCPSFIISPFLGYYFTRPNIVLSSLPYAIFGILSSICCYCNAINEKLDRNRTKYQAILLRFFPTDQQKIILIFNISASISYLVLFIVLFIEQSEFSVAYLIFLLPIIPTIFNALAFYLKEKKYYIGTIAAWGIFGLYCGFILVKYMINYLRPGKPYQLRPTTGHLLEYISLLLVLVINILIGILSPISVYRKSGNQQNNEYVLENPNVENTKATAPTDSEFELDLH